jgi:hypothetical protein
MSKETQMSNREDRNRENVRREDPTRGGEKSAPGRSDRPDDRPSPRHGQEPGTGGGTAPGSGKKPSEEKAGGDRDTE